MRDTLLSSHKKKIPLTDQPNQYQHPSSSMPQSQSFPKVPLRDNKLSSSQLPVKPPKGSNAAPGSKGKWKAAIKHILRERYPDAFITRCPDNVIFAAEDGTHTIKSISNVIKSDVREDENADPNLYTKPKQLLEIKYASCLYYKVIATADAVLSNSQVNVYYIPFDIPQFVPKNKSFEQQSRREGKDEKLDEKGVPNVKWAGEGIYLRPNTLLEDWERIHASSGGPAFRQALSDVFCILMSSYRPPPGKTLLVSGMLSHPSKKNPNNLTTCTKVYAIHSPFYENKVHYTTLDEAFDEYGLPLNDPAFEVHGKIPYMEEGIPSTYMKRLHDHVRTYRWCVPNLRITAGEAEVAMFYMVQLIIGNTFKRVHESEKVANTDEAREWLHSAMGATLPPLHTVKARQYKEHDMLPGFMIKSADTDIITLGLACQSFLEVPNESHKFGGWHLAENPKWKTHGNDGSGDDVRRELEDESQLHWIDPSFNVAIYLDFCSRTVDINELSVVVRKSLQVFPMGAGSESITCDEGGKKIDSQSIDADCKRIAQKIMKKKGFVTKSNVVKTYAGDIMVVSHSYSKLLHDMNDKQSILRANGGAAEVKNGRLLCPIYTFIAAVKLYGDDYVLHPIEGVPMGWYTNAVFSFNSYCNVLRISENCYSNHFARPTVRRMADLLLNAEIDEIGYINLTKGALLECYTRKKAKVLRMGTRPDEITLGKLYNIIGFTVPRAPFYAPKAMRLLWDLLYVFLAQLCPEMVPDSLDMGWDTASESLQVPHVEPNSYNEKYLKNKAVKAEKAANKRRKIIDD